MSKYQDPEFPNLKEIKIGELKWVVVGVYSEGDVTKYLYIKALSGSAYNGVSKMTLEKPQLKRVIANGKFDRVYPWKGEYVR